MAQTSLSLPHDALTRIKMLKEMRDRTQSPPIDECASSAKNPEADHTDTTSASPDK